MPRQRLISPQFFDDTELSECSIQARLLYIGLWCFCEDTAVFEINFKRLKKQIFPYDDGTIESSYKELLDKKKIFEYKEREKTYGFIINFHSYQHIQYPSSSIFPLPPEPYKSKIPDHIRRFNKYNPNFQAHIDRRIPIVSEGLSNDEIEYYKKVYANDEIRLRSHLKAKGLGEEYINKIVKIITK